jgi:undecaprenyl diphosphate synthase
MDLPQHIAIIMDGNGRWAKKRGLPRVEGHKRGTDALTKTILACEKLGIKYLSVYAFSTENWQRPKEEIDALANLVSRSIDKEIEEMEKLNVKLRALGRLDAFPVELQKKIEEAVKRSKNNTGLNFSVLLNYGSRAEIVDAVNKIIESGKKNISEADFQKFLYTKDLPDPDLLIRTASEMRISNFLLWQLAYTEIYVTDVLWPDFDEKELKKAIEDFSTRERRFGKV